jgi:hypothetical protein
MCEMRNKYAMLQQFRELIQQKETINKQIFVNMLGGDISLSFVKNQVIKKHILKNLITPFSFCRIWHGHGLLEHTKSMIIIKSTETEYFFE